jgi:hypothetical protein
LRSVIDGDDARMALIRDDIGDDDSAAFKCIDDLMLECRKQYTEFKGLIK